MNIAHAKLGSSETAQRKAWGSILVTVSAGHPFSQCRTQTGKVVHGAAAVVMSVVGLGIEEYPWHKSRLELM